MSPALRSGRCVVRGCPNQTAVDVLICTIHARALAGTQSKENKVKVLVDELDELVLPDLVGDRFFLPLATGRPCTIARVVERDIQMTDLARWIREDWRRFGMPDWDPDEVTSSAVAHILVAAEQYPVGTWIRRTTPTFVPGQEREITYEVVQP